jgi:hypothetical protein
MCCQRVKLNSRDGSGFVEGGMPSLIDGKVVGGN